MRREQIEETLLLTGDVHGVEEAVVYSDVPGKLLRRLKNVGDRVDRKEVVAQVDRDEPALRFEPADIRAPLTGTVARVFADLGSLVGPQTPMLEIADLRRVKILVQVPEKDFLRLRVGQSVRFTLDAIPERRFSAEVSLVPPALDPLTRSAMAEIHVPNPGELLKPGMFARVEIILTRIPSAVVVPRAAVIEGRRPGPQGPLGDREYYVFVIEREEPKAGKGVARRVAFRPGIFKEDRVQAVDGLKGGEEVVTLGRQSLTDGVKIEIYAPRGGTPGS